MLKKLKVTLCDLGRVGHTCNLSTQDEAGGFLYVQSLPRLHNKFQANLTFVRQWHLLLGFRISCRLESMRLHQGSGIDEGCCLPNNDFRCAMVERASNMPGGISFYTCLSHGS